MIEYEKIMYGVLKKYNLLDKKEDYIDLCYIGYTKAVNNYDESKATLSSYIYKCVENEILIQLRKERATKRTRQEYSMDYIYDDKGHSLNDIVANDVDMERDIIKEETNNELYNAISKLKRNEQIVIYNFYGLGNKKYTQKEISCILNIGQVQISRIKNRALEKLKEILNER